MFNVSTVFMHTNTAYVHTVLSRAIKAAQLVHVTSYMHNTIQACAYTVIVVGHSAWYVRNCTCKPLPIQFS